MLSRHTRLSIAPQKRKIAWFSWGLFIGIALIVASAAGFLVLRNAEREEQQMLTNMKDRADVLIWALEGTARSLARIGQGPMLALVGEVAKQPGIAYIAVVDASGRIIMHSEAEHVGSSMRTPDEMKRLNAGTQSQGHFVFEDGRKIFEVYKAFTPAQAYMPGPWAQGHAGMGLWRDVQRIREQSELKDSYIFVGIEAAHFDEKLQAYIFQATFIAVLIALVGFASIALLFFIQNYNLSKRLLKDTQVLAAHVVDNLPVGLIATDNSGEITLSNHHSQIILDLAVDGKQKQSIQSIPVLDWQAFMDELDTGSAILERDMDLFISKTKAVPVSISASRITNSEGVSSGYLFILRDLGEVRRLQKQVRLNERLSALGNLAAGVAHEIRNPLSSIKGYATYLAEKLRHNDADYATALMLIQETERLNRVVSDLLSVARPGKLNLQPVLIRDLVERSVRLILPDAEEKGISIEVALPQDSRAEQRVKVDTDRLGQALLNLLLNAVQATDKGGAIRVMVEILPGTDNETTDALAISVSDTGSGMSAQTMANLFTPYFTTKASGTGLGLTITHQIVEQHGGEIKVHSQPGKGSAFTVLLPLSCEERTQL